MLHPPPIVRTITIEQREGNWWTVRCGDRFNDGMSWDEMLGQIAAMTCPNCPPDTRMFRMMTEEQWAAHWQPTPAPEVKPWDRLLTA